MKKTLAQIIAVAAMVGAALISTTLHAGEAVELLGAGATFPYPLYSKMFDVYHKEYGVQVNYQSIGSGGGQRQLFSRTVDFGGSDAFLTDEQLKEQTEPIVHIPTCLGAVVLTYNLPGSPKLRFTPQVVADIFLGKITKWNDARLTEINKGTKLPNSDIIMAHRSDGSGTTFIFVDYLSKVSEKWEKSVGKGTSVNWPVGLGGKGNEGVSGLVKQTPGSIGYVELIYALQNKMPIGSLQNKSGKFITPSLQSVSRAANVEIPEDARVSLTNTDSPDGYPISGFTYILVYKEQKYGYRSRERVKSLVNMLQWMTHQGQKYAEPLDYAPLPKSALARAENNIASITYGGQPLVEK